MEHQLRSVFTAYENFFRVFLCSSYVGFVPVSNLLDMYSLIWQGVFSSKFLFVTDTKSDVSCPAFEFIYILDIQLAKTIN